MNREPGIHIREAVIADAGTIAGVHSESWRTTYPGIVPDGYLASIDLGEWERQRRDQLANSGDREYSYVATDQGQIIGWAIGGPERSGDKEYEGELYAIYLLDNYQRRGLGRQLTEAVVSSLVESGMRSILTWVLTDNMPAKTSRIPFTRYTKSLSGAPIPLVRQPVSSRGAATASRLTSSYASPRRIERVCPGSSPSAHALTSPVRRRAG